MKRGGELKRAKPLARTSARGKSPQSASARHSAQVKVPALVKGRRHVNSVPLRLLDALAELERRNWQPSGDLLPRDYLSRSVHFKHLPDKERFLLSCVVTEDGCWEWQGGDNGNGYCTFNYRLQRNYAHRAAYQMFTGAIPSGMTVDHQCHNRSPLCRGGRECLHRRCVNPDHLELADNPENYRRGADSRKECRKGHLLTPENRVQRAKCLTCMAENGALQSDREVIRQLQEGTQKAKAKISDADVETMRAMKAAGKRLADIALIFRITKKYASAVTAGSRTRKRPHPGPTPAVRRLVARRSGGFCEFVACSDEAAHQHHRRPRRMGGSMATESNLPANLLHLCFRHHEWVESYRELAYADGLLLHASAEPRSVPVLSRHGRVWLTDDGTISAAPPLTAAEAS